MDLLDCLVRNPADHPRFLRRFMQLASNLAMLLHRMRGRETRALAVQWLRQQVAEKRELIAELSAKVPLLESELAALVESGEASASGTAASAALASAAPAEVEGPPPHP